MDKVLFTGASGRIGSALVNKLGDIFESPVKVDLLQNKKSLKEISARLPSSSVIESLEGLKYNLAIHLAAIADTNYCQQLKNRERAEEVNVGLTKKICGISDRVILISTDRVFRGDREKHEEYEQKNPSGFYGQTKSEAEDIVLDNNGTVIRIETMLGAKDMNVRNRVVDAVLDIEIRKGYYPFWENDYLNPSFLPDLITAMKSIINSSKNGIYHVACKNGPLSRKQIALEVLAICEKEGIEIETSSIEYGKRPEGFRRIVLSTKRTEKELGVTFKDAKEALREHTYQTLESLKLIS